ncbi:MAG: c-type cytochrome [Verrucomicrobiota bacterium]
MSVSGETLFHRYCSSCHGTDATGKGPIARLLKHPPPDLRTFARRRNGQFSSVELARFIDGRQEVPAHGSRAIPVWGKQFARIEVESTEHESLVSGNLLELVLYIESIQQN